MYVHAYLCVYMYQHAWTYHRRDRAHRQPKFVPICMSVCMIHRCLNSPLEDCICMCTCKKCPMCIPWESRRIWAGLWGGRLAEIPLNCACVFAYAYVRVSCICTKYVRVFFYVHVYAWSLYMQQIQKQSEWKRERERERERVEKLDGYLSGEVHVHWVMGVCMCSLLWSINKCGKREREREREREPLGRALCDCHLEEIKIDWFMVYLCVCVCVCVWMCILSCKRINKLACGRRDTALECVHEYAHAYIHMFVLCE
jgi:hypothetical protein